jgi:hypothetical protein
VVKGRRRTWAPGSASKTNQAGAYVKAAQGSDLGSLRPDPGGAGDRRQEQAGVAGGADRRQAWAAGPG